MEEYLKVNEVINWQHPKISDRAQQIASKDETPTAIVIKLCKHKTVGIIC
jgi:hypothetical protein